MIATSRPILVSTYGQLAPLPGGLPPLSKAQLLALCDGRFKYEGPHRSGRQIEDPAVQRRILSDMLDARPQAVGDFFGRSCDPAQALWDLFYCCCNCCNAFGIAGGEPWMDEPDWFRQYLTNHPDVYLVPVHNRSYLRGRAKRFPVAPPTHLPSLPQAAPGGPPETDRAVEQETTLETAWSDAMVSVSNGTRDDDAETSIVDHFVAARGGAVPLVDSLLANPAVRNMPERVNQRILSVLSHMTGGSVRSVCGT